VVEHVGHKQVAVTIHCDAARAVEPSITSLAVFEACLCPVPCQERLGCMPVLVMTKRANLVHTKWVLLGTAAMQLMSPPREENSSG